MMQINNFIIILFSISIVACNGVSNKAKEKLNKGGETIGETATEIIEGITEGVERTLECEMQLSQELIDSGVSTGKFQVKDGPSGSDNMLTVYFIFEKDFSKEIFVKAYDKKELEIGRTHALVEGNAGEAKYIDFNFDERTKIESRSMIRIE